MTRPRCGLRQGWRRARDPAVPARPFAGEPMLAARAGLVSGLPLMHRTLTFRLSPGRGGGRAVGSLFPLEGGVGLRSGVYGADARRPWGHRRGYHCRRWWVYSLYFRPEDSGPPHLFYCLTGAVLAVARCSVTEPSAHKSCAHADSPTNTSAERSASSFRSSRRTHASFPGCRMFG